MPHSLNIFVPSGGFARDKARSNTGGLYSSSTMLEQGDMPVNVEDLQQLNEMDYTMEEGSSFVRTVNSGEDLQEGVSLERTMYPDEVVRKNSDY